MGIIKWSGGGIGLDAARRELIGSVRFRRWKWCSTNIGSNPVPATK